MTTEELLNAIRRYDGACGNVGLALLDAAGLPHPKRKRRRHRGRRDGRRSARKSQL